VTSRAAGNWGRVRAGQYIPREDGRLLTRGAEADGLPGEFDGEPAAGGEHRSGPGRRGLAAVFGAFAAYAAIAALTTAGQDRVWALWALPGYGAAFFLLWRGRRWTPVALSISVALALVVPLIRLSAARPLSAGMVVVGRSAELLLRDGLPYLPPEQLSSWLSYNPYLPAMALFGLPRAAGLTGLAGHPGVWMAVATVAVLTAAAWVSVPHRARCCPGCRRDVLRLVAVAVSSPVIALNLAVITTDPPVLALMLLSFALAVRPSGALRAGVVLGVACALKDTAWPEIPVLAAMFWSRDGVRAAGRFAAASVVATVVLIAATAPAAFIRPSAVVQNAILFPLGLTRHKTPAQSLLPGHLLASTGPVGHLLAVALLLAATAVLLASLVVRPPRTPAAAALRLAVGLAAIFTFGPDDRFGYFVYPLGLVGWLALTLLNRSPSLNRTARGKDGEASPVTEEAPPKRLLRLE
jgi:Glycosyltransferase family 87